MDIIEGIRNRRSIRSFKPDPVPRRVLEELLEICRWAPSAANTQPWELDILGGRVMEEAKLRLIKMVEIESESSELKFRFKKIYPDVPQPNYATGRFHKWMIAIRDSINAHPLPPGTGLDEKRALYQLYGVRFFDAPNAIILSTEKALYPKALFDLGVIAQTLCLAAFERGLGTCILSEAVYWPDILRDLLKIPDSRVIMVAIAIGYSNPDAPVNAFERIREQWQTFTRWHEM